MDHRQLLDDLHESHSEIAALNCVVSQFADLQPFCAFFCSDIPVDGRNGVRDKVRHGKTYGKFVSDDLLNAVLADKSLQAADRFPDYCKNNTRPLIWKCEPTKISDANERRFMALAADFHVHGGVTIPIHQLDRSTYGNLTLFFDKSSKFRPQNILRLANDLQVAALFLNTKISHIAPMQSSKPVLSPRERDCLALLAIGLRTNQIADRLVLSVPTVSEYISNARKKLGARTRPEAVARALLRNEITL
ncbi:MAG: LuxR C-terminal-related transcriptional regulator [Alphaproteobacteria bacterium]|nr:LuxR C-terminal-related transcriptional regulator [Alphaproteobacteria bacterium]